MKLGGLTWAHPVVGGGHKHSPGPPPQGLRQLPSPGGQAAWKGDGSGLGSFLGFQKSAIQIPTPALGKRSRGRKVSRKGRDSGQHFAAAGYPASFPSYPLQDPNLGVQSSCSTGLLLTSPRLKAPGSKITFSKIGPIPQASPTQNGPLIPHGHPLPERGCPTPLTPATSDFQRGPLFPYRPPPSSQHPLHLNASFRAPQTSRWGDTHFSETQTLGLRPPGRLAGRGRRFRAPPQQSGRSGRWGWAAALLGSLAGSGGAGACP